MRPARDQEHLRIQGSPLLMDIILSSSTVANDRTLWCLWVEKCTKNVHRRIRVLLYCTETEPLHFGLLMHGRAYEMFQLCFSDFNIPVVSTAASDSFNTLVRQMAIFLPLRLTEKY